VGNVSTGVLWALALVATITASGGHAAVAGAAPSLVLEDFPPVPNDYPPGASRTAWATAAAMGRGVNFNTMPAGLAEGAWGQDEFIDVTARAGFASVRLPVLWSDHADAAAPFTIDPQFFAQVESIVDKLLARDLYVVLNYGGDELTVNDDAILDVRFLVLWQQIAARFRGKNDHLLFELYNEPHGWLTPAKWNDLAARALNVVRKRNPRRVVIIGPTSWNDAKALPSLRLPNDADLIVTIHNYQPFDFTHQGATWVQPVPPTGVSCCDVAQQAAAEAPLTEAKAWADATHYPIFLGEFGAYSKADMQSRVNFTRLMRDQAEARGMPWAYWELVGGFGVYDPVAHAWRAPLKDALLGP
jgi:endoglucanase